MFNLDGARNNSIISLKNIVSHLMMSSEQVKFICSFHHKKITSLQRDDFTRKKLFQTKKIEINFSSLIAHFRRALSSSQSLSPLIFHFMEMFNFTQSAFPIERAVLKPDVKWHPTLAKSPSKSVASQPRRKVALFETSSQCESQCFKHINYALELLCRISAGA